MTCIIRCHRDDNSLTVDALMLKKLPSNPTLTQMTLKSEKKGSHLSPRCSYDKGRTKVKRVYLAYCRVIDI